ncbi:protein ROOT HAIR DEFECTIVE 3 homolog 2-like isoform X3 [Malus domestica]|uniref:protein ROOT HAIR DEFECTIVE 3 homolog 2-like isoform X3 n=1 Tax=Malus domestica TaxID=3750 RepID=UPI003975BBCD
MSKNFKYESDSFGKMQMGCDWEVVDVKFTSQDSCDSAYFSLKVVSAELPESVIEALHDESDIGLFVYPAYSAMLGHLRSKALEDFQVRLEQSLNKGEGFASSVILVLSLLCLSLRKDVQMLPYNKLIGMLQKSGKSFDVI